ncbi:MAG: hypothetical protein A2X59_09555 [Nitrospirae bacterium GWC2_42_7]|nr:MAG: hypothetical protein A2X59_09555 [Nitrospirae bacterium GWC2_42_7]
MKQAKAGIIFIIVLLFLTTTIYFFFKEVMIENPAICKYCHFIRPYYNKWERSTHKMVPCLKCHEYGPFNALSGQMRFIAGTYNPRPLTNVPDTKCLQAGCHDRRLIESKVSLSKWNIVFDHKPHFTEHRKRINLHCRSCHSDIVQGEHMKVSINVCFLCHLSVESDTEDKKVCTTCHRELKKVVFYRGEAFNHMKPPVKDYTCSRCHTSVKIGEGIVSEKKCFFCHVDRTGKYSDVEFIHGQHIGEKQIDCFFCHEFIEHGNIKIARDINGIIKTK